VTNPFAEAADLRLSHI